MPRRHRARGCPGARVAISPRPIARCRTPAGRSLAAGALFSTPLPRPRAPSAGWRAPPVRHGTPMAKSRHRGVFLRRRKGSGARRRTTGARRRATGARRRAAGARDCRAGCAVFTTGGWDWTARWRDSEETRVRYSARSLAGISRLSFRSSAWERPWARSSAAHGGGARRGCSAGVLGGRARPGSTPADAPAWEAELPSQRRP